MNADDKKTQAVTEQAQRDALTAAHEILAPLGKKDEVAIGEYMKHVLLAVKAVHHVRDAAQKLVEKEKDQYIVVDAFHIVATALWCVTSDADPEEYETHPYSIAGMPFLGFARACLVLEAASNYQMVVTDYDAGWLSDCAVDEAVKAVTKAEGEAAAAEKSDKEPDDAR